jgi:hypothetical protein
MTRKQEETPQVDGVKIVGTTFPDYTTKADKWDFMKTSYIGGKPYIETNLFQYYIEGDSEFNDRKERAHRENHCKKVVDLFNSYLFQEEPTRDTKDERLQKFHNNMDGKGKAVSRFMRLVSLWSAVFGRLYVIVDKPELPQGERTGTAADDLKAIPYCYMVYPQDIKDIAFNKDGSVKWVIIVEHVRDDGNPFDMTGDVEDRYRLWTSSEWFLFDDKGNLLTDDAGEPAKGTHDLGKVPIVIIDNEDDDQYDGQSLIGDIAYLDRAIFNNWSRLDAIVCDQTFSQLIFPIEGLPSDIMENDELREKFLTIATNRILLYSAQAQVAPSYISPDASQAEFILSMIESQTKQLYASLGLKAETGTDVKAESGVAKAFDFDKLDKMLANKADNLEQAEREINELFGKWTKSEPECVVDYPESFNVKSLADEIALAQELALLQISETFTKEIEKMIALKALPKASDETMDTIKKEIDEKSFDEEPPADAQFDFDG